MRKAIITKEGNSKGKKVNVGKVSGKMYYCTFPGSERAYKFWKNDLKFIENESEN